MKKNLAALMLGSAIALFAQAPAPRPFRGPATTDDVKTYLNLTDDQLSQLQTIQTSEQQAGQPIMDQIAAKEKELRDLIAAGGDAASIGALQLEIKGLFSQLAGVRKQFADQAKALLTSDQQTLLQALNDAAKLQPAIAGARMLNLLDPPTPPAGGATPNRRGFAPFALRPGSR